MKITLEIPADDAPFILSGSLKGWLRGDGCDHTFRNVMTIREQDAFVRLVDVAVLELELQSMLELTETVKS